MSRPVCILLVQLVLIILPPCNALTWKCPDKSQWFLRSDNKCKDKTYLCLFDTEHSTYKEICGKGEEIGREGFKYILTPNPDQVPCAARQYQPFTFTTNGNSQCVFRKSLCKCSGQILAHYGNASTDVSCRCDYRQNYDYVIPPKDSCSCKPAVEDCSCYIRKCADDEVMIADYRCMKNVETILPEDIRCPIIDRIIPPEEPVPVDMKPFKQVSSSCTWSKQASVILIVVFIIFTVLIGFLFFSVPHVTSILLKSELELPLKRKEHEFMIFNGDKIKIECNVKSYIPVRSVKWQKERDGEIIQITPSVEKYVMDYGKRHVLTIYNFNSDDQGKYICIVRNVVGLRTEMFGSCMHYMSRFGCLTGFVSVLQNIPVFYTEDITLHNYEVDSQSEPTVYNVYKGDDITMEQHINGQQRLEAVKWFKECDKGNELDIRSEQNRGGVPDVPSLTLKKSREEDDITIEECCDVQQTLSTVKLDKESDTWTEINLIDEQYSGGVPDVPSLTIKDTRVEDAGNYLCFLIYDNSETQKALFRLKIIPQVKIYKALCEHRKDRTFIRPAVCDTIYKHMQENKVVVITGREGTGKSKICLELASLYDAKDYTVLKVDLFNNHSIYTDIGNAMLIIDDNQYTKDSLNAFIEHLVSVLPERNIQVVLTCRNLDLKMVRNLPEMNNLKNEAFIDINSCLTPEEKEEMLRRYMEKNSVTSSFSVESNFRNQEILTDLYVQVALDDNAIKEIRNAEPWIGFPLCASLFCSKREFLHLGDKYFTNPPRHLVEELKELYKTARKSSNCIDTINNYCVLVYIMKNNNHHIDLNDSNLCSQVMELYQTIFLFKHKPDKPGSNEDPKIAIVEAVHRMNKYLKFHEGVYEFIHPCLLKAMFRSSDYMVYDQLQNGSLYDITEFVRSEQYTFLENELGIKIGEDYQHILCERLTSHAFENLSLLQHVAHYIYSHWRSSGKGLVNKMFNHIEFILFRSLEAHTVDFMSLEKETLSEKSIKLQESVQFSKIIMLVDELTYNGRDPWIYGTGTSDFLILSALVSAAMRRYATKRNQTFKFLLDELGERMHFETFVKLWSKPLDIYGNSFFHYLMLFKRMDAPDNLYVNDYIFDTENSKEYTPLDIAAYLGKVSVLEDLNLKTNCTNKLRERLQRLVKSGHFKFHNESIKSKMDKMDNTNDNDATFEKLQSEDADVEKVNHKSKKMKILFKRTFSHSKNKPKKIEKHGSNYSELEFIDVLCFDDDMIKVIDFGNTMDYNAIIHLLSK